MLELQCYPQLYANFIVERRQSWDEEPLHPNPNPNSNPTPSPSPSPNPNRQSWDEEPLQDVGRCLEHLLTIIIRTVEGSTKGQDNLSLTAEEASLFFKRGGAAASADIMKEINKGTQDGKGNAPSSRRSTPPGSNPDSRGNSRSGP